MNRTILIQHGDIGPVRLVQARLDKLPRLLTQWQGGSLQPLRVRAVHQDAHTAVVAACEPYHQHRDWYGAHALRAALENVGPGLPQVADQIDADHQATLTAPTSTEQARLAGWTS